MMLWVAANVETAPGDQEVKIVLVQVEKSGAAPSRLFDRCFALEATLQNATQKIIVEKCGAKKVILERL